MNTFYLYLRKDAVFTFMFFLLLFFDGGDLFTLVIQLYSKHIIGKGNNKQMLEKNKINESYYGLLEASVAVMQSRSQSPLYTFSREEERGTWGWGYIAVSQPRERTIKAYSSGNVFRLARRRIYFLTLRNPCYFAPTWYSSQSTDSLGANYFYWRLQLKLCQEIRGNYLGPQPLNP